MINFYSAEGTAGQDMLHCFTTFSLASGLRANLQKSGIYFGGVPQNVQQQTLEATGMVKGVLSIIVQCQPMLDKLLGRIKSWTAKSAILFYAGRLQLIKSVLFAVQIYWSQLFQLPKKIIQVIEQIRRTFLWTGKVEMTKKALLAWEKLCLPKVAGGRIC